MTVCLFGYPETDYNLHTHAHIYLIRCRFVTERADTSQCWEVVI